MKNYQKDFITQVIRLIEKQFNFCLDRPLCYLPDENQDTSREFTLTAPIKRNYCKWQSGETRCLKKALNELGATDIFCKVKPLGYTDKYICVKFNIKKSKLKELGGIEWVLII